MNEPHPYDAFVARARTHGVPPGFTDTVVAALPARDVARGWRVAAWVAAVALFALRVGGALSVFWAA